MTTATTFATPSQVRLQVLRVLIIAVPAVALIITLYGRVLRDLVIDWWTIPWLSQGLLIPPLTGWIVWTMRAWLQKQPAVPDWKGLLLVTASCLLFLFGQLAAEFFLTRMSFVGLLAGLVWTFWGFRRLRVLIFPLLLFASAIPLPSLVYNSVAAPLQLFATAVSARIAEVMGVSLYADGNVIYLAHMTLGIEEACSGLSSISTLVVASVLLGFTLCSTAICRLALVLLSVPTAIVTNILRVTVTALLVDVNSKYAVGFYHSFSGWLVFALGFTMLYGCGLLLRSLLERRR